MSLSESDYRGLKDSQHHSSANEQPRTLGAKKTRAACSLMGFGIATQRVRFNADSPSTSYISGNSIRIAVSSATFILSQTNNILPKNAQRLHAAFREQPVLKGGIDTDSLA